MDIWSSEFRVAMAPDATYARLAKERIGPISGWRMVRRPAMVLLVISTLVPIMAVQRVTLGLVATTAITGSFVVAIQLLIGAVFVAVAPGRRMGFRRALDLWFAGHLPYSLWMLVLFAAIASYGATSLGFIVVSAVLPAAWTAAIVSAFCRNVLGAQHTEARWRAAGHAVGAWVIGLTYVVWAAGGTAGPIGFIRHATGLLR